ncbi:polysaccharide pyruvyl transferase [Leptolyngbya sp. NIES-3755]|nr:polysaccharide pyruvyl transferase [Leptolyngbya sp. NIES-3755]
MKIIISNTIALNGGDAAILIAIVKLLREAFGADTEFLISENQPEAAHKYYPELKFRRMLYSTIRFPPEIRWTRRFLQFLNNWRLIGGAICIDRGLDSVANLLLNDRERQSFEDYHSADLIVSTGGTYLVENYGLRPRILDYQISQALGKPLVFFTQSLGPFRTNAYYRNSLKPIFEKAALMLLRDQKSQGHLTEIGIQNPNRHVTADAVFALADQTAIAASKSPTHPLQSPLRIAISVREWKFFKQISETAGMEKYIRSIQSLITHLVQQHGAQITFISTCQGIPEYWTDDSKTAFEMYLGLPEEIQSAVKVDQSFRSPHDLIETLKTFDVVIPTRMHMAILALGAGVPVLPIAYEFKTQELFATLGLEQWVHDIETVTSESLIESFDAFLQALPEIRPVMFQGVEQLRQMALESGKLVKQAYEAKVRS